MMRLLTLFALGVDDDAEEFSGRVKKDATVTERDLPVATPVAQIGRAHV